jgi:hypothetical protein
MNHRWIAIEDWCRKLRQKCTWDKKADNKEINLIQIDATSQFMEFNQVYFS